MSYNIDMRYPIEYRQKVFAIKAKKGLTFEETAEYFEIPIRTIFRWSRNIEPKLRSKIRNKKIDEELLQKDVDKYPDGYQYERAKRFGVSVATVCRALKQLKISHKKKSISPKSM
jgi:transposase